MARTASITGASTAPATTARRTTGTRAAEPARPARTSERTDAVTGSFRQGAAEGTRSGGGRAAGRGFSAFKTAAKETGRKVPKSFRVEYDKTYVIVFLEAENFDFLHRHWVDVPGDDGRMRSTPRNCIKDYPEDGQRCPLCDIGDDPKPVALFNVVDLDAPDKVQIWEASTGIFDEIDGLATSLSQIPEDRGGPLGLNSPGIYAAVSKKKSETKSGRGGVTKYSIIRVKERDLDEDHSLGPISDEQLDVLFEARKTLKDVGFSSYDDLRALADSLED